jgi:hypothetical protein
MNGTHVGFSLPASKLATCEANDPALDLASSPIPPAADFTTLGEIRRHDSTSSLGATAQNRKVQKLLDGHFFVKENLRRNCLDSQRLAQHRHAAARSEI